MPTPKKLVDKKGKPVTARFRVKRGRHHTSVKGQDEAGSVTRKSVTYGQGDVFESDLDLAAWDPAKFERLDAPK